MFKVLLVDPEDGAMRGYRAALEEAGFEPTFLTSPRAALKLVETRLYAIVGCDASISEMSGTEFLSRAAAASPGVGLFLVATSDDLMDTRSTQQRVMHGPESRPQTGKIPGMRVLLKPYDEQQLVTTLGHLARMAEMRKSTHAMASAVARPEDEMPSERPPRSVFPPRR
ncbi:MAG TPA: hypothetical protein VIA18_29235 [Polyangia bacterium]|jgi:CheY-like chemotaxis protein|nr:hypothetical protein [Polyangia bacterium]